MEIQANWLTTLNSANDIEQDLLEIEAQIRESKGYGGGLVNYFRNILIGQLALYIDLETGQKALDASLEATNKYLEILKGE